MKLLFEPFEVCKLVDCTYTQLRYWDISGLLHPSKVGKRRRYTFSDLIRIQVLLAWNKVSSIQKIRKVFGSFETLLSRASFPVSTVVIDSGRPLLFASEVVSNRGMEVVVRVRELVGRVESLRPGFAVDSSRLLS